MMLLSFLIILGIFFLNNLNLVFYLLYFFVLILLLKNFYLGLMFFNLSFFFFFLIFMSLMILGLIFFSEKLFILKILSFFLVIICILFFLSSNIFYIYLFFEFSLFPILVMILGFGYQIEKISSSYYLMFYTLFCSMPFFFFIFNLDLNFIFFFFNFFLSWEMLILISLMFLMKFPVFFLHLWLPKAHVEASTSASMLLAGLLLKLGTGGFIRLLNSLNFSFLIMYFIISFLGMVLSNFYCILQSDLKSLAAFSSINHMSFVLFMLVLMNNFSIWSSMIIMISHGYISILMFYFIGEFYHIFNTRMLYFYSGLFLNSLFFSILVTLTWLYNSGIPFSLTFFSEFSGFLLIFNFNYFFFFLGFLYFFMSFYYSLYYIVINFIGKQKINLNYFLSYYSSYLIFLNSNIFFFILLI